MLMQQSHGMLAVLAGYSSMSCLDLAGCLSFLSERSARLLVNRIVSNADVVLCKPRTHLIIIFIYQQVCVCQKIFPTTAYGRLRWYIVTDGTRWPLERDLGLQHSTLLCS